MSRAGPVIILVAALFALWYAAAVPMNIREALTAAEREGVAVQPDTAVERRDANALGLVLANPGQIPDAWAQDRPRLPAPHQVAGELWQSVVMEEIEGRRGLLRSGSLSNRGLLLHAWITLSATALGFVIGAMAGIALAIGIVHSKTMEKSVMPWAIVSQTVPIVALAPMIVVVLYSVGLQGLLPKAIISAYLSFFPVVVGMVKGLRAPDAMQTDLMRTWDASGWQVLTRLRLPASMPYLFASMKIAVAAALVGAIVGELPVQGGGLGARMLAGSYYGQTAQIWAALLLAAALAAVLVAMIGGAQRLALRRMGGAA
ncbi:NitT/TauT family transport system permease protein [Limimaricola soesokkakensis]|uniref:NitT/TauT family transport system permease protein n=1 Tax=Limimaricola soesokkakensis TaxID=1343159 RepID=A0A1X6ZR98_9RHOB|nr:ABC transporter permease [Limimaricola soesokkakensis]PSK84085.1 NitT/TauT family transport system permease protein [Limimaricola soesokkakensis]SLN59275.1 Putative aliphatic sulfonates transport permease protein SsuC [Limimaricola soesokkakensis]